MPSPDVVGPPFRWSRFLSMIRNSHDDSKEISLDSSKFFGVAGFCDVRWCGLLPIQSSSTAPRPRVGNAALESGQYDAFDRIVVS